MAELGSQRRLSSMLAPPGRFLLSSRLFMVRREGRVQSISGRRSVLEGLNASILESLNSAQLSILTPPFPFLSILPSEFRGLPPCTVKKPLRILDSQALGMVPSILTRLVSHLLGTCDPPCSRLRRGLSPHQAQLALGGLEGSLNS